jgi:hypothetical protein
MMQNLIRDTFCGHPASDDEHSFGIDVISCTDVQDGDG